MSHTNHTNHREHVEQLERDLTDARAENALLRREIDELRYALKEIVALGSPSDMVTIAKNALLGGT